MQVRIFQFRRVHLNSIITLKMRINCKRTFRSSCKALFEMVPKEKSDVGHTEVNLELYTLKVKIVWTDLEAVI